MGLYLLHSWPDQDELSADARRRKDEQTITC
jgi:hypothetical protein